MTHKTILLALTFVYLCFAENANSPVERENVVKAVLFSIVLPGGGHYYNRQFFVGGAYTVITAGAFISGIALRRQDPEADPWVDVDTMEPWYSKSKQQKAGTILFYSSIGLHIVDAIHAGIFAKHKIISANRGPLPISLQPKIFLGQHCIYMGLNFEMHNL
jgi:hypothetical protein